MQKDCGEPAEALFRPRFSRIVSRNELTRSEWNGDETFFYLEQASDNAIFNGELFKDKD